MDNTVAGMLIPGTEPAGSTLSKPCVLSLRQSGSEMYFYWEDQLIYRFKASLLMDSREVNKLRNEGLLKELVDFRETRILGFLLSKDGVHTGNHREGYTLYTRLNPPAGHEFQVPGFLLEIWKPGFAIVDNEHYKIYISRFNR